MVEGRQTDESQTLQGIGQSKIPELDCLGTAHSAFRKVDANEHQRKVAPKIRHGAVDGVPLIHLSHGQRGRRACDLRNNVAAMEVDGARWGLGRQCFPSRH